MGEMSMWATERRVDILLLQEAAELPGGGIQGLPGRWRVMGHGGLGACVAILNPKITCMEVRVSQETPPIEHTLVHLTNPPTRGTICFELLSPRVQFPNGGYGVARRSQTNIRE